MRTDFRRVKPLQANYFPLPLKNAAQAVADRNALKIVAIGSSSTEGAGGSVPYPRLLELALKHRLPDVPITVLNRGKGGEEAGEELARFETDVISADPNLVIWQVGTNAVWKPVYDLDQVGRAIQAGLALLNHRNTDIIIMDPQYAPAVLQQPLRAERMVRIIAELAAQASANVFTRFALMGYWNVIERVPFTRMIATEDDGTMLHQNDWSYERVAKILSDAITRAVTQT